MGLLLRILLIIALLAGMNLPASDSRAAMLCISLTDSLSDDDVQQIYQLATDSGAQIKSSHHKLYLCVNGGDNTQSLLAQIEAIIGSARARQLQSGGGSGTNQLLGVPSIPRSAGDLITRSLASGATTLQLRLSGDALIESSLALAGNHPAARDFTFAPSLAHDFDLSCHNLRGPPAIA